MIALEYAKALFELSGKDTLEIKENFTMFIELLSGDFKKFLESPAISKDNKKEVIKKSLKDFNQTFIDFIYVVIDNNRCTFLEEMYSSFNKMVEVNNGLVIIDVYTAKPLTEQEEIDIVQMIGPRFPGKIKIHNILDGSLLGGMRIECNGDTIDQTFKTQMHKMKAFI